MSKLIDTLNTAGTCRHLRRQHPDKPVGNFTYRWAEMTEDDQADVFHAAAVMLDSEKDLTWARVHVVAASDVPVLMLCKECWAKHPSQLRIKTIKVDHAARDAARLEDLHQRFAAGETFHRCGDCESVHADEELVPARHCPHCDENFDGSDGRNCTECNRPFTSKVADAACPECFTDETLEVVTDASKLEG